MPVLRTVLSNATETIITRSIEKYYAQRNWRWEPRPLTICNDSKKHVYASTVNPPKKSRLQDIADSDPIHHFVRKVISAVVMLIVMMNFKSL